MKLNAELVEEMEKKLSVPKKEEVVKDKPKKKK